MAQTKTVKGKIETFLGNPITPVLTYAATYEELVKGEAVPKAEQPDEDGIRKIVNAKRLQNARSKAVNQALTDAGYERPTLEDESVQISTMAKVFVARGMSEEEAVAQARTVLGL